MAAVTSSSPPPNLPSIPSATENHNPLLESIARPSLATPSVLNMNPQASSPLHTYPEPIPSDAQMSGGTEYFTSRRSQQPSLSQEDQNLANSLSHNINGHMNELSPQLSSGQAPSFGMGTQSGLPQTPQQPPIGTPIPGQHSGADPNQDLSYGMGTDLRKRSKVSRACDECRRKKVRCDSTASDSNVIGTCSNCRRLKLTCQFERPPMKRGPSKGYIKELAERVQQVESQMGIPTGYRPSIDAASQSDAYPEQPYSPTEPMSSSRKRTFSQFDGRNPFTQPPQSSRNKMASLSGYSINQAPQGERASFALAPDQQLADISPTAGAPSMDLTKPFWAQDTDVEHPRAKESQMPLAAAGNLWDASSLFIAYVKLIHDDISILPRSFETVQNHVSKCPQELASAFTYVLAVACASKPPDGAFASDSEIEDYAWTSARFLPLNRHVSENIVWLWMYSFMIIDTNADITRLRGSEKQLSKRTILKMAIDLGQYLLAAVKQDEVETADDVDSLQNIVQRTWACINILAQLHAIGTGTEDAISSSYLESLALPGESRVLLAEPTAFLSALSSILSLLSSHIAASPFGRPDSTTAIKTRKTVESCVAIVISTFPPALASSSSLVQEAQLFISLLLARHTFVNDPSEILDLALKLVDLLYSDPVNPQGHEPPITRPLDIHLYSLTGLTLLELIDNEDDDLTKPSQDALAKLRHALEQVSERAHTHLQNRLRGGRPEDTNRLHWADALIRVINTKGETDQGQRHAQAAPEGVATNEPQNDQQEGSINGNTPARESVQVNSVHQQYLISRLTNVAAIQKTIRMNGTKMTVVDFSLLTRRGYLNVLADLNGF